jgi:hypothetical protein
MGLGGTYGYSGSGFISKIHTFYHHQYLEYSSKSFFVRIIELPLFSQGTIAKMSFVITK